MRSIHNMIFKPKLVGYVYFIIKNKIMYIIDEISSSNFYYQIIRIQLTDDNILMAPTNFSDMTVEFC